MFRISRNSISEKRAMDLIFYFSLLFIYNKNFNLTELKPVLNPSLISSAHSFIRAGRDFTSLGFAAAC